METDHLESIHSLRVVWRRVVARQFPSGRHKAPGLAFLPVEIILAVIEYLDERSKARVVQTNRYFQDLVEPILYRHICLDPDQARRNPLRSHLLHDTLSARRDLLPYVFTYYGPLVPNTAALKRVDVMAWLMKRKPRWYRSQTTQPTYRRDLSYDDRFEIAKTIFSGTINIRELHFTDYWASFSFAKLWKSFDTTKANMNIEKLVIAGSPHLITILRAQPGLKHLVLFSAGSQLQELQKTDIPELSALKATISDAAVIIPGRPVKKVELMWNYMTYQHHPQNPAGEALFHRLALSACGITDFTVWFHRSWNDEVVGGTLRLIAQHLPRIERLCLSVWGGVAENLLLEAFVAFSSLRHLRLIGAVVRQEAYGALLGEHQLPDGTIPYNQNDITYFFERLKEGCPELISFEWCRRERYYCCREEVDVLFRYHASE